MLAHVPDVRLPDTQEVGLEIIKRGSIRGCMIENISYIPLLLDDLCSHQIFTVRVIAEIPRLRFLPHMAAVLVHLPPLMFPVATDR